MNISTSTSSNISTNIAMNKLKSVINALKNKNFTFVSRQKMCKLTITAFVVLLSCCVISGNEETKTKHGRKGVFFFFFFFFYQRNWFLSCFLNFFFFFFFFFPLKKTFIKSYNLTNLVYFTFLGFSWKFGEPRQLLTQYKKNWRQILRPLLY